MTDDELWRALDKLARSYEPALAEAVQQAFLALGKIVSLDDLMKAVIQGPAAVLALFPETAFTAAFQTLPTLLHQTAVAAGQAQAKWIQTLIAGAAGGGMTGIPGSALLPGSPGSWKPKALHFAMDTLNPRVIEAVNQQAASLVVQISQQTRDTIREQVRVGMLWGENPRETARAIRQNIGLTARQQQAVANFRNELMTFHERRGAADWNLGGKISRAPGGAQTFAIGPDGKPLDQIQSRRLRDFRYDSVLQRAMQTGQPLTPQQIDRMVDAYQKKYLRYRSETIARTESLRASNIGADATWRQAIQSGTIKEHWLRRFWVLGRDDRTCLTCRGVHNANPEGRAFDEPFITPYGEQIRHPPLHPGCRCVVTIRAVA